MAQFRAQDLRVQALGFMVWDFGFGGLIWIQTLGFRVLFFGLGVLRLRVKGWGFRVRIRKL